MKDTIILCPYCNSMNTKYVANIGAPGYGQSWKCDGCGEGFVVIGNQTFETAPELTPDMVR